jgi:hypothetical protein
MIALQADQEMFTDPGFRVVTGGDYDETDQVEVYRVDHPEQRVAFYAIYVATGQMPSWD